MSAESKVPKDRHSILRRVRPFLLAFIPVVAVAFARRFLIARYKFQWLSDLISHPGALFGIIVAAVFAFALLWKVPQWQVDKVGGLEPKERFDRVNEARKTLAQIIGGIAILAGFYSTVQNLKVAQESQILSHKSFALSQEGQITDRFTRAIEQLGAVDSSGKKKLEVRLGGIYELQRIANESEEEYWPIMEVLTAYVRDNAPIHGREPAKTAPAAEGGMSVKPPTDIQAILTVLGTRTAKNLELEVENRQFLNLRETDLSGAHLLGTHFSGADLSGANLSRATLYEADLRSTWLVEADLGGAFLKAADLSRAHLRKAKLMGAKLMGAELMGAKLMGADLSGADLSEADLSEADLSGADLSKADLRGANLRQAYVKGADFSTTKNMTQQQIDFARGDVKTLLPAGLRMPEAWRTNPQ
jgi:uncharacterized protein YjbI with pentapeptide repeats